MASAASVSDKAPADLVELGRIVSAYGVRGWVKVQPHSPGGEALLSGDIWWLRAPVPPGSTGALPLARPMRVTASRPQGATVVAQLDANTDRDVAEAFKAYTVWVSRADFPSSDEDEYYWIDLIGCSVFGEHEGQPALIGIVQDVVDNGAHGILRVVRHKADDSGVLQPLLSAKGRPLEELVPFVAAHVHTVDLSNKRLYSNWPVDL
ncbi:ribosome maturation factor RimM [Allopusillimonas ginsengisoli]|uniref:ribosome maturation factor RimM n=1 Tax=Allopusillimonas ginsengisoli TaxID=453575 RepID=UPI00101F1E22|nr:ribosome maturation factor RimM [Allopusillimonas ginsengisoli]TEA77335.1 ribosome maturation factor RimM [Allopusillimonas ginsengisoli]